MLDARRTTLQLPLMREVTALQKNRILQDPRTSSSVTSGGSSGTGKNKKLKTFLGDPHKDAQALAIELSGKLAKSAEVPSLSDGGTSRPPKLQRRGEKCVRVGKMQRRRAMKAMTAEELGSGDEESSNGRKLSNPEREPIKIGVRERIKRIESAFERSTSATVSGELRKEGLIKELKARGSRDAEQEIDGPVRSDDRWDGGLARREELARKIIEEQRGSSVSSLSQLLGNHYGSGRSAFDLLGMVADEEHRNNFAGESLFESDEELSPMEMEMSRPRMVPPPPLMSRGRDELKKPRTGRARARKRPGSARLRERSINLARPRSAKSSARLSTVVTDPPPPAIILDDELAVSELPEQNGCGIPWDWSRIHKYGGKAFLDLTGLTCTLPEGSKRHPGMEPLMAGHNHPVQSISSLDSDANALPLIIGEDAHDSDVAGYYIETGRPREIPEKQAAAQGKRKLSLQNAVKDVPVMTEAGSTSRLREDAPPDGHRTLTQKYRPKNFTEIVGQAVVVKSLSTAIMKAKVAPVYLFMGPRGTGKTSAARVFAAGLNCLSLDYGRRPCGICRECGTMALNRSADVRQIDAASCVDLASMRAMMGSFTPHARYKVFIVEGCDLLSADIWNAFLKVLEEPPPNVVFVLITTDAERIPVTATSRCQKFLFAKVKESDIVKRLGLLAGKEGLVVEAGALSLIAARSDGSLRDAEIVLDQLCLLDKNVSVALVQELVGILPDSKVLDLLDYALSANTVNTVRTLRQVLGSGVEPLVLVSQLGGLITDILVGSLEIDRDSRKEGFFTRNLSAKEELHRLRLALKILSDAEKQLRVATDRATWLTAALLQFAPDRSFSPSEVNTSAAPSPTAPDSAGPSVNYPIYNQGPSEPEEAGLAPEPAATVGEIFEAYAESKTHPTPEEEVEVNVATLSEQKLEEAWAGEPQQQVVVEDDGEISETQHVTDHPVEFQEFRGEALAELWKRVLWKTQPRNLKNLLQTHGRLVGAGLAVDGSCAIVELEFDYARDKHKAERSWRSICIAFQAVLSTAVELRIGLSAVAPDETEAARIGETVVDIEPSPSAQPNSKEIVNEEDPNPNANMRDQAQGAPSRPHHRRRGRKSRRHRHASEFVSSSDPSGITPRRPPNRRRRVKKSGAGKAVKPVTPTVEIGTATEASTSVTREVWDSMSMEKEPQAKKPLSTHMEEPQSEIEDLQSAQRKIMSQRSHGQFRNDSSLSLVQQSALIADLQRGLPKESALCWGRPSPPQSDFLMRKSRVKSVKKAQGKAMFLRLVPCRGTRMAQNDAPAAMAPVSGIKAAEAA